MRLTANQVDEVVRSIFGECDYAKEMSITYDGDSTITLGGLTRPADRSAFNVVEFRAPLKRHEVNKDLQSRIDAMEWMGRADEKGDGRRVVQSTVSSTSVDAYGTEMSLQALEEMHAQMTANPSDVVFLPTHGSWLTGLPDWDQVIGRSIDAEIEKADVAEPYAASEQGYVLHTAFAMYSGEKAAELIERLDDDQPIGASIGGWFTSLKILLDEDGYVDRMIIMGIILDHVAATRMPANPDSYGMSVLRSMLRIGVNSVVRRAQEAKQRDGASAPGLPATEMQTRSKPAAPAPEPAAVEDEPSSRTDPGNTESVPSSDDGVDSVDDTGNHDDAGTAASRQTANQETDAMDKTELEAIIAAAAERSAAAAIAGMDARFATIEEKLKARAAEPTPDPAVTRTNDNDNDDDTEDESEIARLRARIAVQEETIDRMANSDTRAGMQFINKRTGTIIDLNGDKGEVFRGLADACRESGQGVALASVIKRSAPVLAEEFREDGTQMGLIRTGGSKKDLLSLLSRGVAAAFNDGLIGQRTVTWS